MSSKCVVNIGFMKYVVNAEDAITLCGILSKAERYDDKYHGVENDKPSFHTYHVWEQDTEEGVVQFSLLPEGLYRVAKMAGKPQER